MGDTIDTSSIRRRWAGRRRGSLRLALTALCDEVDRLRAERERWGRTSGAPGNSYRHNEWREQQIRAEADRD